jgi:hypothetical protein
MIHPLTNKPPVKKNFVPSKWEHKRIIKIVRAIRNGWIKPKKFDQEKPKFYLLWDKQDKEPKKHPMHIPAPKLKLPGHEESYNPPPEYLPTDEEKKKWEESHPDDRPRNFLPKKSVGCSKSKSIYTCLSVCPYICLPACLPVCLSIRPSVRLSVRLSVCLSVYLSVCQHFCFQISQPSISAWLPQVY